MQRHIQGQPTAAKEGKRPSPIAGIGESDVQYVLVRIVSPCPLPPAIHIHHRIKHVHAGLPEKMTLETETNVDDRVEDAQGVVEDICLFPEPNAGDAGGYAHKFPGGRIPELFDECLEHLIRLQPRLP